jgi:ring-1,2-phenylacetyl-CoA epoxidase subunit PaaB
MKSLDPRVERLPGWEGEAHRKTPLDQWGTFEVFVMPREGKPFQHEGALHAPNLEMAYVLAKETFTRRFTCFSICVADTRQVFVSATTEADQSVFGLLPDAGEQGAGEMGYELYALFKRGKQHVHVGSVKASSPIEAMRKAQALTAGKVVYNVWAIRKDDFRFTEEADLDFWLTLPDKKFRDAADYKGGDKLKEFLGRNKKAAV